MSVGAAATILKAISIATSLAQLANQAASASAEVMAVIQKAQAEGREVSDAELDEAASKLADARQRYLNLPTT